MNRFLPSHLKDDELTDQQLETDALKRFIRDNREKKWLAVTIPVSEVDPLAYIEQIPDEPHLHYWEKPDLEFAIASGGAVETLKSTGAGRFRDISMQTGNLKQNVASYSTLNHSFAVPLLLGGYAFSDYNIRKEWESFGTARFVLPEWMIIREGGLYLLTLTLSMDQAADEITNRIRERYRQFSLRCEQIREYRQKDGLTNGTAEKMTIHTGSYKEWQEQVLHGREMIRGGEFLKIVIARNIKVDSDQPVRVTRALYYLREHFPGCYIFMIRSEKGPVFIGATPERLISLRRNRVLTEGLAGSISRGESATEDAALEHRLMGSLKDRSEHDFVVRDIRDNLQPFSRNLEHPHRPRVKKLDNVQHLYTPISASTRDNITIHELAGTLHPTPAVGGYPRDLAVPHIQNIEMIDRGWYAGPVGWAGLNGSGEFAVAIRSALIDEHRATLYAGCGIMADSDPAREWKETELKLKPLLNALKQAAG